MEYLPESLIVATDFQRVSLTDAIQSDVCFCAPAIKCSRSHDLIVALGDTYGIIPRDEVTLEGADAKDIAIISRVGKKVVFTVTDFTDEGTYILSRRNAQLKAQSHFMHTLKEDSILQCVVTHIEPFGAFVDIGYGIVSLIGIDTIATSHTANPAERFTIGQRIYAAVTKFEIYPFRIHLTHKELLGTWSQNAQQFEAGETVSGIVKSVLPYGIFVELSPNLLGLAEYRSDVKRGMCVSVYIKSILPDKFKIKLTILSVAEKDCVQSPLKYHTDVIASKFNYYS